MQLRETIEELRSQMYATMDHLEDLSVKELNQRASRRTGMEYALHGLLSDEEYFGSWQELPVEKEDIQSLVTASDQDAEKLLGIILHAPKESRVPEDKRGEAISEEEYASYGAMNEADVDYYRQGLANHGVPELLTKNPDLNGMDLSDLLAAYESGQFEAVNNHMDAFLFLQSLNEERAEALRKDVPLDDVLETQTQEMGNFLFTHPNISEELAQLSLAESFSDFVYDRMQQELSTMENFCIRHGAENQYEAADTILATVAEPYSDAIRHHATEYKNGSTSLTNYLCFKTEQSARNDSAEMQSALLHRIAEARHGDLISKEEGDKLLKECSMYPAAYHGVNAYYQRKGREDGEFYKNMLLDDKKRNDLMVAVKTEDTKSFVDGLAAGQSELGEKKENAIKIVKGFLKHLKKNLSRNAER